MMMSERGRTLEEIVAKLKAAEDYPTEQKIEAVRKALVDALSIEIEDMKVGDRMLMSGH